MSHNRLFIHIPAFEKAPKWMADLDKERAQAILKVCDDAEKTSMCDDVNKTTI